ncbi:toxin-antitoxin system YwqK family antitoxin [Frigoriflavimonas asaccharolytica]
MLIIISCGKSEELMVAKSDLVLQPIGDYTYYRKELFTGKSVLRYENLHNAEIATFRDGRKEGLYQKFFGNGKISYEANYKDGNLDGIAKSWWGNGNLRSESFYRNEVVEGEQKQYYQSGKIFKVMNFTNGLQDGMQKAWRENGKIYNNYQAKNGRIFGLKRATLCLQLEDEKVQY